MKYMAQHPGAHLGVYEQLELEQLKPRTDYSMWPTAPEDEQVFSAEFGRRGGAVPLLVLRSFACS